MKIKYEIITRLHKWKGPFTYVFKHMYLFRGYVPNRDLNIEEN